MRLYIYIYTLIVYIYMYNIYTHQYVYINIYTGRFPVTLFVFSAKWPLERGHLRKTQNWSVEETSRKVAYPQVTRR